MTKLDDYNPNDYFGPDSFGGEDFPPLVSEDDQKDIDKLYELYNSYKKNENMVKPATIVNETDKYGEYQYNINESWIQTYSGRRFNPLEPVVGAILIQDIAHALSMQCRFSGHTKSFYSVAQHSVGVSYLCDEKDALWGLLHDAPEAYLVDIPRPLKHSGKFDFYKKCEANLQKAICTKFVLPEQEPDTVKKADNIMLATEARDLMSPLHKDWINLEKPLPFKIIPMSQQEAKNAFMKRFFELMRMPDFHYEHYLKTESINNG